MLLLACGNPRFQDAMRHSMPAVSQRQALVAVYSEMAASFGSKFETLTHDTNLDLSQSQLQSLSSCVICCQLYERHRHVSSAVCRHHLSKLLNPKQSRPSPAVAQRQVVAVGAMCPAMLLRHPVAAGGLWWSVLNDCVKMKKLPPFLFGRGVP